MTPEILREIGRMLHGEEFVPALARDLKLNARSLQRMLAGERGIPPGLARECLALIDAKRAKIARKLGLADGS